MRIAGIPIAALLGAVATGAAAEAARPTVVPPLEATPAVAVPTTPETRHARDEGHRPPRGRTCLSQAETREKIAQRRLADPVSAMRAGRAEGEALRVRLCRWKSDEWVYEVFVLRRDGHIVRLYMDAQNGQAVNAPDPAERK